MKKLYNGLKLGCRFMLHVFAGCGVNWTWCYLLGFSDYPITGIFIMFICQVFFCLSIHDIEKDLIQRILKALNEAEK